MIERVGLDIAQADELIEKVGDQVSRQYRKYSQDTAVEKYDTLIKAIGNIRTNIYEENSVDTIDASGVKNGYIIDITSLDTLKRVYLLNSLERKIKTLRDIRAKNN